MGCVGYGVSLRMVTLQSLSEEGGIVADRAKTRLTVVQVLAILAEALS